MGMGGVNMSNKKVMIVDDEMNPREVIRRTLMEANFDVSVASNGEEALEKMKNENFNIAFVDIVMPGIGGFELLKTIKQKWPEIIVIMITGYISINSATEAIKLGANDYIAKPFIDLNSIVYTIYRNIELKNIQDKLASFKAQIKDINNHLSVVRETIKKTESEKLTIAQKKLFGIIEEKTSEIGLKLNKLLDAQKYNLLNLTDKMLA